MKYSLVAIFLTFGAFCFGQTKADPRLMVKFSQDQLKNLEASSPQVIAYWNFYLDHSYTIEQAPAGKDLSTLPVLAIEYQPDFNILSTNLTMLRSSPQHFRLAGSDQLLILLSNDAFVKKFNATNQN